MSLKKVFVIREGDVPTSVGDPKIEKVLSGPEIANFTREDWVQLAMAALDQAGLKLHDQDTIAKMIRKNIPLSAEEQP